MVGDDLQTHSDVLAGIQRKVEQCFNCRVSAVYIGEDIVSVEIQDYAFGNFVDARSLMSLLQHLHDVNVVGSLAVRTVWLGTFTALDINGLHDVSHWDFSGRRMFAWCRR